MCVNIEYPEEIFGSGEHVGGKKLAWKGCFEAFIVQLYVCTCNESESNKILRFRVFSY
jgi:hypothetical protein